MAIAVIEIIALLGFLALPLIKWPKKKILKYKRPDKEIISSKYAVNKDGEIEELINKEGKKEDF